MQPKRSERALALGVTAAALTLAWLLLAVYVVHAALPANALTLPGQERVDRPLQVLMPQGWAFFTRSPREPQLLPFLRQPDGSWRYAHAGPHSEPSNALGLNRRSRAQGPELAILNAVVPEDGWRPCEGPVTDCLATAPVLATVPNRTPDPSLCGQLGMARQEPVPWAWARSTPQESAPSEVARLEVTC